MSSLQPENPTKKIKALEFVLVFLTPTLVGKALVLYFGQNYSAYPGEGYGYGLALSIIFTLLMIFRFLWKYRNHEDP